MSAKSRPMSEQTRRALLGHYLGARSEGRVDRVVEILVGAAELDTAAGEPRLMDELRQIQRGVA